VSIRQIARKLDGKAKTYIGQLLGTMTSTPVDGYRAELICGIGNDAIRRIVPAPQTGTAELAAPLSPKPPEPMGSEMMASKIASCFQQLRAHCLNVTPSRIFELLADNGASDLRTDMSAVMAWLFAAGIEPSHETMLTQDNAKKIGRQRMAQFDERDVPDPLKNEPSPGRT
jgi:hypothetical protein